MIQILASVTDKTGLVEFAKTIKDSFNEEVSFIASGGTAKTLTAGGIDVVEVSDVTKSPEMLSGRVKTLHPVIHAGILARNNNSDIEELAKYNINSIDIVICNLYEFEKTITTEGITDDECIENIDIGGIALLRAAAKNFQRVLVLCDPKDYNTIADEIIKNGKVSLDTKSSMAAKAFALCTSYDAMITSWFNSNFDLNTDECIYGFHGQNLRYGENPHQCANLFVNNINSQVLGGKLLQGKQLSYNNILDADAAWRAVSLFKNTAAVVIKHLTPCGIAETSAELKIAVESAIACDPVSAYGSIIAVNTTFDVKAFYALSDLFLECLIAPKFTDEAKQLLSKKKNCRVIESPIIPKSGIKEFRSVVGGFLMQDVDLGDPSNIEYKVVTNLKPEHCEENLIKFAWKACTLVKSNAILLASYIDSENPNLGSCSVGIGCGQPNRVDAAKHAVTRAGNKAKNSVLASDAFLPFPDTVEVAAKAGIKAIIQPGGSIRDDLSIDLCNKKNISMTFTGIRHFRH